jgi:nitrile hydratase
MPLERFAEGDVVRVREDYPIGHFRTPVYIRGKTGVVTRRFGAYGNPETLAFTLPGEKTHVYEVRFRQVEIWPDYKGSERDSVHIDLQDNWLEQP